LQSCFSCWIQSIFLYNSLYDRLYCLISFSSVVPWETNKCNWHASGRSLRLEIRSRCDGWSLICYPSNTIEPQGSWVWRSVVSQLVNAEVGTTPICLDRPLASSSRCGDLRTSPPSAVYSRSLVIFFVRDLSLSYVYVIHRLGGKNLHADVHSDLFLGKATSPSTFLASCWDQWTRSENQMSSDIKNVYRWYILCDKYSHYIMIHDSAKFLVIHKILLKINFFQKCADR